MIFQDRGMLWLLMVLWTAYLEHTKWMFKIATWGKVAYTKYMTMGDQLCHKSLWCGSSLDVTVKNTGMGYGSRASLSKALSNYFPNRIFFDISYRIRMKRRHRVEKLFIMSDNQTAIQALSFWTSEFRLVLECHDSVNKLNTVGHPKANGRRRGYENIRKLIDYVGKVQALHISARSLSLG